MEDNEKQLELPGLSIRKRVLFPGLLLRLTIGRPKSVRLAQHFWDSRNHTLKKNSYLFISSLSNLTSKDDGQLIDIPLEAKTSPSNDYDDNSDASEEFSSFYKVGTLAKILQLTKVNSTDQKSYQFSMLIEGVSRAEFQKFTSFSPFFRARVAVWDMVEDKLLEIGSVEKLKNVKALGLSLRKAGAELVGLIKTQANGKLRSVSNEIISRIDKADTELLVDLLASLSDSKLEEKQAILSERDLELRLQACLELVNRQIEIHRLSDKIQANIDDKMKATQREFYLRQQLKAIQGELNEISKERGEQGFESEKNEIEDLQEKLQSKNLPVEVKKTADKEFNRLKSMQPSQPEFSVIKTYLDLIVDLPWNETTTDNLDIFNAERQLNSDHFGLQKVKRRILEFLAVLALNELKLKKKPPLSDEGSIENKSSDDEPRLTAPILCLVGPPGVGKTSLGKSVAKALNRQFARLSLGGVRDEAEIRGHRKTYIGALPGKIIQIFRKTQSANPLILLDEIDKVSSFSGTRQGDVSSALLEVLDPEQNDSFTDHYLNLPFDLSKTMFIATANDLSTVPRPLLDRMEIIEIPSYTLKEKLEIAKRYLIPKQLKKHSVDDDLVTFSTPGLEKIIANYTREAGVRGLERQIAAICRAIAVHSLRTIEETSSSDTVLSSDEEHTPVKPLNCMKEDGTFTIEPSAVVEILGSEVYETDAEMGAYVANPGAKIPVLSTPGVSLGLAFTPFGGDILYIETAIHFGSGKIHLTGQLGKVMSESVNTALSFIKANAGQLGLKQQFSKLGFNIHSLLSKVDFHVHFPAGAVPKDGPSAGIAISASILSAISGISIRADTACTGEISLRGVSLPVGGIKEKVLAAHRAKLKRVVLPERNTRDLIEIPKEVLSEIEIIPVKTVFEGLSNLFPPETRDKIGLAPKWIFDFPQDADVARPGDESDSGSLTLFSDDKETLQGKDKDNKLDCCGPILRSVL